MKSDKQLLKEDLRKTKSDRLEKCETICAQWTLSEQKKVLNRLFVAIRIITQKISLNLDTNTHHCGVEREFAWIIGNIFFCLIWKNNIEMLFYDIED